MRKINIVTYDLKSIVRKQAIIANQLRIRIFNRPLLRSGNIVLLITMFYLLSLTSCSERPDYSETPAKEQIAEYSAKLKKCEAEKQQLIDEATKSVAKAETIREPVINVQLSQQRSLTKPSDDDMILGETTDSNVVFIEYFSPTCPHCAYYEQKILPAIKAKYVDTNKITYIVREFVSNKQDLDASLLARCKGDKESFFKFISVLLAQQDSWAVNRNYRDILTNIGQLGGISADLYTQCLSNEKLAQTLIDNTKLVSSMPRFVGTPAFFINGIQFMDPYTLEAISQAIDKALQPNKL